MQSGPSFTGYEFDTSSARNLQLYPSGVGGENVSAGYMYPAIGTVEIELLIGVGSLTLIPQIATFCVYFRSGVLGRR
jgi:hypothetical protein